MVILKTSSKMENILVDGALRSILASDFMKEAAGGLEAEMVADIDEHGYPQRFTDVLLNKLDNFFEQDLLSIVKPKAVFNLLQDEMKIDLAEMNSQILSREAIKEAYDSTACTFTLDRTIGDILEAIHNATRKMYEKQLDDAWKDKTVERFKDLEELTNVSLCLHWKKDAKMIYVLPLNKDDKLVREPFPDMSLEKHPLMKLTAEYTTEISKVHPLGKEYHYLHVKYNHSITQEWMGNDFEVTGTKHTAKHEEVKVAIVTT